MAQNPQSGTAWNPVPRSIAQPLGGLGLSKIALASAITGVAVLGASLGWAAEVPATATEAAQPEPAAIVEADPPGLNPLDADLLDLKEPLNCSAPTCPTLSTSAADLVAPSDYGLWSISTGETFSLPTWANSALAQAEPEETPPPESTPSAPPSSEDATSVSNLAAQSQNPIANLISVPFQNNTNFGVGQFDRTSNVLNIQPVVPTPLSQDWVLINRFIVPLIYQPELAQIPLPDGSTESIGNVFGLGDIIYEGFFSPRKSGSFTWGVGPILSFPTATDDVLGTDQWSAGPAVVGLVTSGHIVAGALVNQLWSFAGDSDRPDVSQLTLQPFFNYNFAGGWYVTTSPIITANWQATGEQWTVPIGGGFGRVFKIGRQPVNVSLSAYWNATKPEGAADWTLRTQVTLLFP